MCTVQSRAEPKSHGSAQEEKMRLVSAKKAEPSGAAANIGSFGYCKPLAIQLTDVMK